MAAIEDCALPRPGGGEGTMGGIPEGLVDDGQVDIMKGEGMVFQNRHAGKQRQQQRPEHG